MMLAYKEKQKKHNFIAENKRNERKYHGIINSTFTIVLPHEFCRQYDVEIEMFPVLQKLEQYKNLI